MAKTDPTDNAEAASHTGKYHYNPGNMAGKEAKALPSDDASTTGVIAAMNRNLKDQPLWTLAVTAACGFLMGALWKT